MPPGTVGRSACAAAEQLVGTCGFVFDHESQDNSAVVALLRDVSKNPGLAAWHSLGTRRPLRSVPISAVTAALGGLRLGGVVVMAKVGLWMQEVSHSLTGSGGVWHNQSCHCEPPALSSGGGGVSPFGEGGCKGTGGLCSPLGDVVTPITAPAQHMAHCVPPLHPSQGARCPQTHPIPEPRAPGAGPRRTAQLGMAGSLGVCHQCLRLCASCEPAPLEFAQEAGNRGRRRARANGGGGERARVRGAQLHCRGSAWAHGEDMRGDYRCCAAMGL